MCSQAHHKVYSLSVCDDGHFGHLQMGKKHSRRGTNLESINAARAKAARAAEFTADPSSHDSDYAGNDSSDSDSEDSEIFDL